MHSAILADLTWPWFNIGVVTQVSQFDWDWVRRKLEKQRRIHGLSGNASRCLAKLIGIIRGIMGDKKEDPVFYSGSLLFHSVANIVNGFVHTANQCALGRRRRLAGIGAGQGNWSRCNACSGIGDKKTRYCYFCCSRLWLTGAVVAYFISKVFDYVFIFHWWRLAFACCFCASVFLNQECKHKKKNFEINFMLATSASRFRKFILSILDQAPNLVRYWVLIVSHPSLVSDLEFQRDHSGKQPCMPMWPSVADVLPDF